MNRMLSCLVLAALAPLAACSSSSEAAPPAQARGAAHQAGCPDVLTRARTCSTAYVAALVDTRARLDVPPGIAADVKADRAGVIAKATAEWQADSTDAGIAATCQKMAAQPAEEADRARACLAQQDCAGFVACVMPIFEAHLRKQIHK